MLSGAQGTPAQERSLAPGMSRSRGSERRAGKSHGLEEARREKGKAPGNVLRGMEISGCRGCRLERNREYNTGRGRTGHKGRSARDAAVQLGGRQSPPRAPGPGKLGAARGAGRERPPRGGKGPGLPSGRRWSKPSHGRAPGCSRRTSPEATARARGSGRSADGRRCPQPALPREPGRARGPAPTPAPARRPPRPPPRPRAAEGWAAAEPEGRSSLRRARCGPRVRAAEGGE